MYICGFKTLSAEQMFFLFNFICSLCWQMPDDDWSKQDRRRNKLWVTII